MQEATTRILVLLAIFGSVFLLSQVVLGLAWNRRSEFSAINKRLRMIREGGRRDDIAASLRKNAPTEFLMLPPLFQRALRGLQRMLLAAGVSFTMPQLMLAILTVFALLLAVIVVALRSAGIGLGAGPVLLSFVVAACVAIVLPLLILGMIAQRRRRKVEQQFPIALDVFVRALRSGHPIASAIDLLTREMEDPIGSEFGLVSDEVSYGAELTDALDAMADRWNLEDMRMFVVSLSVQNETGGNLAEILENLSNVIRARASMFMKVRALSSEGRMTAWMLTVLPIFAFVSLFMVNPGFYLDITSDPIFLIGFPGLILMYITGVLTIRRMVDLKV